MATVQSLLDLKALNIDSTTVVNKAFLDHLIDVLGVAENVYVPTVFPYVIGTNGERTIILVEQGEVEIKLPAKDEVVMAGAYSIKAGDTIKIICYNSSYFLTANNWTNTQTLEVVTGIEGVYLRRSAELFAVNNDVDDVLIWGFSNMSPLVNGGGVFGWGNSPSLNIAGDAYNRFTLSEAEYAGLLAALTPSLHSLATLTDVQIGGTQPTEPSILFWIKPVVVVDIEAPHTGVFTISDPQEVTTATLTVTAMTATDNVGVTGWMILRTDGAVPATPAADDLGWLGAEPTTYTIAAPEANGGWHSLFAAFKDAAGNVYVRTNSIDVHYTVPSVATFTDLFNDGSLDATHFAITSGSTPSYTESTGSSSLLLDQASGYQSVVCKDILVKPTNDGDISYIEITMQRGATDMLRSINFSNYHGTLPAIQDDVFALDAGLCYWPVGGDLAIPGNTTPWVIPSSAYTGSNFVKHTIEVRNNVGVAEYRITQVDSVTGLPVVAGSQSDWIVFPAYDAGGIVTCDQWSVAFGLQSMTITKYVYHNAG